MPNALCCRGSFPEIALFWPSNFPTLPNIVHSDSPMCATRTRRKYDETRRQGGGGERKLSPWFGGEEGLVGRVTIAGVSDSRWTRRGHLLKKKELRREEQNIPRGEEIFTPKNIKKVTHQFAVQLCELRLHVCNHECTCELVTEID